MIIAVLVTALSLTARYLTALYPTADVTAFVFVWMKNIQKVGFTNFWTVQSDYFPLYMFVINLLCLLPTGEQITVNGSTFFANWMYYLKTIFFIAEILSAVGIYLIVKYITKDKTKAVIGYCAYLILPVQFLNSAVWGNCDSLYFCAFIYIIYFILTHKDIAAYFTLGIAFSIKLQSVFIFPLIVFLILNRRLKLWPSIFFFVGWMLSYVPSWACGAPFSQPFSTIVTQMGGYKNLTLGCANIWHLFNVPSGLLDLFNAGSTVFALVLIGFFLAVIYIRKINLTDTNLLTIAFFLIVIVPFFLPHMHERYLYALEALALVYCLIKGKRYWMVVATQVSGVIAYYHYLSGKYFISALGEDSVTLASFINLAVLAVLFYDILKLDRGVRPEEESLLQKQEIENLKKTSEEISENK